MSQSPQPLPTADELKELTGSIFHAIGRNLVALQELESTLRFLVTNVSVSGPASQLERLHAKRAKALGKKGMGELAQRYGREVLTEDDSAGSDNVLPEKVEEVHLAITYRMQVEPDELLRRRSALRRVVVERNRLVHKLLEDWQRDSVESCRALLQRLSSQHQAVSSELQVLRRQADELKQAKRMTADLFQSEEGQRLLAEAISGAFKLESDPI